MAILLLGNQKLVVTSLSSVLESNGAVERPFIDFEYTDHLRSFVVVPSLGTFESVLVTGKCLWRWLQNFHTISICS